MTSFLEVEILQKIIKGNKTKQNLQNVATRRKGQSTKPCV